MMILTTHDDLLSKASGAKRDHKSGGRKSRDISTFLYRVLRMAHGVALSSSASACPDLTALTRARWVRLSMRGIMHVL
jgi:hypothetical protein